jgi:filamentous hemagglutinin family protein
VSRSRNFGLEKTGFLGAIWAFVQLCLVVALPNIFTLAQITPDTTLGAEGSRITPGANVQGLPADLIEGGAQRNTSLFHSFQEFNVNNGQRVYFANPIGIENIFSRVTGTNVSNILGTLGVKGNANLFLLNPNGIIFGSNARLDVNGSFLATTGNSFQFPDGTLFSATNPQAPSLLSINVPLGVQYGAQPGKITVNQANLNVGSQQSLILLGGDIELNGGGLNASGGFLQLGGLAGEGGVGLEVNSGFLSLGDFIGTPGNISISGTTISATATGTSDNPSGNIGMAGRNVQITGSSISSVGNNQSYGTIEIDASESVLLNNATLNTRNSTNNGIGGDILINAPNQISIAKSEISSEGYFGRIFIGSIAPKDPIKPRTVVIDNSTLTSETASTAKHSSNGSGLVSIRANETVEIKNKSQLNATTSGKDDAGNIEISAPDGTVLIDDSRVLNSVNSGAEGNGGLIGISAPTVKVTNNSQLDAGTFGKGNAGNIEISAPDGTVVIDNESRLYSDVVENAQGNPGYIGITARNLLIDNAKVSINDQSSIDSTNSTGVDINDLDSFDDLEKVPGLIYISAEKMTLDNKASIEADSASTDGGNIFIEVSDRLLLRRGSLISAKAGTAQQGGGGKGGNIGIFAEDGFVVAVPSEDSDILANAFGGKGGKIGIQALRVLGLQRRLRLTPSQLQGLRNNGTSDISASSDIAGLEGEIEIETLALDPAQGLVKLPVTLVDSTGLIAQGCESRNNGVAQGQKSTFVVTGRGGLPPNPDNPLSTGATPPPWVTRDSGRASKSANIATLPSRTPTSPLVEAQGMVIGSKGEVILTAGVAAATPHPSGFSAPGCSGER